MKLVALVLALVLPILAAAEESAKDKKVRQLLVLMNVGEMGVQVADSMLESMKSGMPQISEEFWTAFRKKVKGSDLVDLLIPVYSANLEEGDIDALITFYQSPSGRRFLEKQPIILQQSMVVGQKWGEDLANKAIEELQAKRDQ